MVANPDKSNLFVAGIDHGLRLRIQNLFGFPLGTLPMRYLGVPLITTKLCKLDCLPLRERITRRITSWTNRFLSYAGRLQLIKSVLFSIQSFWSAHFILPTSITRELEALLRRFLWSGVELKAHTTKVAWDDVTLPFEEGGVGIKKIKEWNRAFIAKGVWNLCHNGYSSVWKDWVKANLIRHHTFWQMKIPQSCSWTWRKLLQLRPILSNHIRVKLGNGASTSFWFDPWMEEGPICKHFNDRVILESGLGRNIKVGDLTSSGEFAWPFPNCDRLWDLNLLPRPKIGLGPDSLQWMPHGKDFSVRLAWDTIRDKGDRVPWAKLVWAHPTIPKCSFITWLAIRGKLLTLDKLQKRGITLANRCVLCLEEEECLGHVLSTCKYSREVWNGFRSNLGWLPHERGWDDWVRWASGNFKGKTDFAKFGRLLTRSIIYHIWKERNARLHGDRFRSSLLVHGDIHGMICMVYSPSIGHCL